MEGQAANFRDPGILSFFRRLRRVGAPILHFADNIGDMARVSVEHRGHIERKGILRKTDVEPVGKSVRRETMQCPEAVFPMIVERFSIPSEDLYPKPAAKL
jgi:hypothetical protein